MDWKTWSMAVVFFQRLFEAGFFSSELLARKAVSLESAPRSSESMLSQGSIRLDVYFLLYERFRISEGSRSARLACEKKKT